MSLLYYLVSDTDPRLKIPVDVEDYPVDGDGDVSEDHAAHAALDQLGYSLLAEDKK